MRIAQVAPLFEPVPPLLYGGTERVVSYLSDQLVELGHDVTLFASGDSRTQARLHAVVPRALRLEGATDPVSPHIIEIEHVAQQAEAEEFDVIHFHVDAFHFPLMRRLRVPSVNTLHGRLDLPELGPLYREFPEAPVVSISDAQRVPLPWLNWRSTVYHGIPVDDYPYRPLPEDDAYLAFVGRTSPEKGLEDAVAIARATGHPLRVAGKVDRADRDYFNERIAPLLEEPHVEFLGEVDEAAKLDLMGGAVATLFPITWPEPFGLVMVESMACGTPVIGYRHGSVPEVIDHGETGFVVDSAEEACSAVRLAADLDRKRVRSSCRKRFHMRRMAQDYERVYEALLTDRRVPTHDLDPQTRIAAKATGPPVQANVQRHTPDPLPIARPALRQEEPQRFSRAIRGNLGLGPPTEEA